MICSVEGCERPTRTNKAKFCQTHYFRWKNGKDMDAPIREWTAKTRNAVCEVENCNEPQHATKLCKLHYSRKFSGVPNDRPKYRREKTTRMICQVRHCYRVIHARKRCRRHYEQYLRMKKKYNDESQGTLF